MFSPLDMLWLLLLVGAAGYLWHADKFKQRARSIAIAHCKQLNLQLLDQSIVISGLWPVRGSDGRLLLRRRYRFEFASTGDRRYHGELEMLGLRLERIDFEAYRLPDDE